MKKIISLALALALVISAVPLFTFAESVTSIEYTPANEIVYYENANGIWRTDGENQDYFEYHTNFNYGDVLKVNYSSDNSKEYTCQFENNHNVFKSADNETLICWENIFIYNPQNTEHWYVNNSYEYYVEMEIDGVRYRAPVNVRIEPNPVKAIEYIQSTQKILYFETSGYIDTDINGNPYFHYNVSNSATGDILRVTYDDRTVDYKCIWDQAAQDLLYVAKNEKPIPQRDVGFYDKQSETHYEIGDKNEYYVRYMGFETTLYATVLKNPISSINFIPANDLFLYEHTHGEWEKGSEGNDFYRYYAPDFQTGDRLEITYSENGETVVYTFYNDYIEEAGASLFGFFDEQYNELPDSYDLSRQYDGIWEKDKENVMNIIYKDVKSNDIIVSIIENPVYAIRYEQANPIVFYEGDTYHDDWDNKDYYRPYTQGNDRLIVIDKNGNETAYTYDGASREFKAENNNIIEQSEVQFKDEQSNSPWVLGQHPYRAEYMGKSFTLYAEVIESPVKAIEYTPKNSILIYKGYNIWKDYHDGIEYEKYIYQQMQTGDVLTIITKDNQRIDYTLVESENHEDWYYQNENGDRIDVSRVNIFDEQYNKPWDIGNDNEYYVEYMGKRFTLYATMEENPVKAIEYIPVNDPVVYKGLNCYYDEYYQCDIYDTPQVRQGDKLIITDNNDERIEYVAVRDNHYDLVFINEGKPDIYWFDINFSSNQYEKPWDIGKNNEYFVQYMGKECKLYCEMRENPVKSIEFTPKNPVSYFEGTHTYFDESDKIYLYDLPRVEEGDILSVEYIDNSKKDFIMQYDSKLERRVFKAEDGEIIDIDNNDYWYYNDTQYETPWGIGDNIYYIIFMGQEADVHVNIKEYNFVAIEYKPIETPKVFETEYHTEIDEEGKEHKIYRLPDFQLGDVLSLIDENGNHTDYTYEFCEEDGEYYFVNGSDRIHRFDLMLSSEQETEEWAKDKENYFDVVFNDFTTKVKVEIVETDVQKLEFIKAKPIEIEKETGGEPVFDEREQKEFYFYHGMLVDNGDKIRITYKDETVEEYTVHINYENEEMYAATADGKRLNPEEINVFDRQYDKHWTPGRDNCFYVLFHGVETSVPVTIIGDNIAGDIDGNEVLTDKDAEYMLFNLFFPEEYPLIHNQNLDFNKDKATDTNDVIYLLYHIYFPKLFKLPEVA